MTCSENGRIIIWNIQDELKVGNKYLNIVLFIKAYPNHAKNFTATEYCQKGKIWMVLSQKLGSEALKVDNLGVAWDLLDFLNIPFYNS